MKERSSRTMTRKSGEIAVPRLALSLWFEGGAVESVGWGVLFDDDDKVLWPT